MNYLCSTKCQKWIVVNNVIFSPADAVSDLEYYFMIPDEHFNVGSSSGYITVRKGVGNYNKYLLYLAATDNGDPEFVSEWVLKYKKEY